MPKPVPRKGYKKKYRKKGYKKQPNKWKMTIQKSIGFPDTFITKLKHYTVPYQFTSGGTTTQAFRINSLYDPDYSVGGGQPYYFDQMMLIYERYQVYGCKIKVDIMNRSTSVNVI